MKTNYFLVIENAPDVCEGIIRRMAAFEHWIPLGYCAGVKEAVLLLKEKKPELIFLDWSLNGGSAFEILQFIQNETGYNPYIIFNTGFQRDNPEIPQEIVNTYRVDKYLVKPLWENLRQHLRTYLLEAEEKALQQLSKPRKIWLEESSHTMVQLNLDRLICICQHPTRPRCRIFYTEDPPGEIAVELSWQHCIRLLESNGLDFFITKKRSHLVLRNYLDSFEKPFVRLRRFPAKIEVVKESIKDFESWLTRQAGA